MEDEDDRRSKHRSNNRRDNFKYQERGRPRGRHRPRNRYHRNAPWQQHEREGQNRNNRRNHENRSSWDGHNEGYNNYNNNNQSNYQNRSGRSNWNGHRENFETYEANPDKLMGEEKIKNFVAKRKEKLQMDILKKLLENQQSQMSNNAQGQNSTAPTQQQQQLPATQTSAQQQQQQQSSTQQQQQPQQQPQPAPQSTQTQPPTQQQQQPYTITVNPPEPQQFSLPRSLNWCGGAESSDVTPPTDISIEHQRKNEIMRQNKTSEAVKAKGEFRNLTKAEIDQRESRRRHRANYEKMLNKYDKRKIPTALLHPDKVEFKPFHYTNFSNNIKKGCAAVKKPEIKHTKIKHFDDLPDEVRLYFNGITKPIEELDNKLHTNEAIIPLITSSIEKGYEVSLNRHMDMEREFDLINPSAQSIVNLTNQLLYQDNSAKKQNEITDLQLRYIDTGNKNDLLTLYSKFRDDLVEKQKIKKDNAIMKNEIQMLQETVTLYKNEREHMLSNILDLQYYLLQCLPGLKMHQADLFNPDERWEPMEVKKDALKNDIKNKSRTARNKRAQKPQHQDSQSCSDKKEDNLKADCTIEKESSIPTKVSETEVIPEGPKVDPKIQNDTQFCEIIEDNNDTEKSEQNEVVEQLETKKGVKVSPKKYFNHSPESDDDRSWKRKNNTPKKAPRYSTETDDEDVYESDHNQPKNDNIDKNIQENWSDEEPKDLIIDEDVISSDENGKTEKDKEPKNEIIKKSVPKENIPMKAPIKIAEEACQVKDCRVRNYKGPPQDEDLLLVDCESDELT